MSNEFSGLIECKRVDIADLCADACNHIKKYQKDVLALWEQRAIECYTKRWLLKDRTPAQAIEYARDMPFCDRWFYANAYDDTYRMCVMNGNVASSLENDSKTMFVSISNFNRIVKWAKEPPVPEL